MSLAFSSDGIQLAALDKQDNITLWQLAPIVSTRFSSAAHGATDVANSSSHLIIISHTSLLSVDLHTLQRTKLNYTVSVLDISSRNLVVGRPDGIIMLLSQSLDVISQLSVCKRRVSSVKALWRRQLLAYACDDGAAGVARYSSEDHSLAVVDSYRTDSEGSDIATDPEESLIFLSAGTNAFVHDVAKMITKRLEGQMANISAISPPSKGFPYFLTGDVKGIVRVWNITSSDASVLARSSGTGPNARFSPDGSILALFGIDPVIRLINIHTQSSLELRGHTDMVGGVRYSKSKAILLSFSWDGTVRVWRTSDGSLLGSMTKHNSIVEDAHFTGDGRHIVSVGDDGILYLWDFETGLVKQLLFHRTPLLSIQVLAGSDIIVTRDIAGSLWTVTIQGLPKRIRQQDDVAITLMNASPDGRYLAIGHENGSVVVFNTRDWTIATTRKYEGAIARMVFDPKNRDLLIQSEDDFVHSVALPNSLQMSWELAVDAHDLSYSSDGELLSVASNDGGLWFYSRRRNSWSYSHDHEAPVWSGQFSPDGSLFVSADHEGTVVLRRTDSLFH
ncbi:MAG TPA: WD40 repeat domain-containing protein [Kofleriaceae bacterium]|nr:WD40 repeat domain-containing protein [Kofleriaceae bacterium]